MADEFKTILAKLEQIENRLNVVERRRAPEAISQEEVAAYLKVRDVIAWDPDTTCGINETSPGIIRRCWWVPPPRLCICACRPCDAECSCGPCAMGGGGAIGRFGSLGG